MADNWIIPEGILNLQPRIFNSKKHILGDICSKGHEYQDGKSLRYLKGGACVECLSSSGKSRHAARPLIKKETWIKWTRLNYPEIEEKYYLGFPCEKGHTWGETPYNLRYVKAACFECSKEQHKTPEHLQALAEWRKNHKEQISEYNSRYWQENQEILKPKKRQWEEENKEQRRIAYKQYREEHKDERAEYNRQWHEKNREERREYRKAYYEAHQEEIRQYSKDYAKEHRDERREYERQRYNSPDGRIKILAKNARSRSRNRERIRERTRKYYRSNRVVILAQSREYGREYRKRPEAKHLARIRKLRRRAREEQVHHYPYTQVELSERLDQFKSKCAYCGKTVGSDNEAVKHWDHFIPLSKGGADCIGNLVPSCSSCNQSKNNRDPQEWYAEQPFYSLKQWKLILKVLGKTQSSYNQLPLF
jgi:hypothetical protein